MNGRERNGTGAMTVMAGTPAMNLQEVRLMLQDEAGGRHWSRGGCWCGAGHRGGGSGMLLVPPPWDEARRGESAP